MTLERDDVTGGQAKESLFRFIRIRSDSVRARTRSAVVWSLRSESVSRMLFSTLVYAGANSCSISPSLLAAAPSAAIPYSKLAAGETEMNADRSEVLFQFQGTAGGENRPLHTSSTA
jgi:hypothetical protein